MLKTKLCELLEIEYPIMQGGMAWVADASLAAAVSNAGGLGIIAGMNSNGEQLRAQIRKAKELTNKPFGVNVMLMSPFAEEAAAVICEEKIPVVTTGAGNPTRFMAAWKEAGCKVIPVVPSAALAKMVERRGASAVIAEGGESGGHIGELHTMALVPQVCEAVNIPVIAAGGIVDGRGLAAALMLGACGVQMGTRFIVADECTAHDNFKEKVLAAKDIDTLVTGKRLGHPCRALKNDFSRKFAEMEYDMNVSNEELEAYGAGALRRAVVEGDLKTGSFLCGECAGMVKEKMSCRDIIQDVVTGAEALLGGASQWLK